MPRFSFAVVCSRCLAGLAALAMAAALLTGCQSGGGMSASDEERFKNPPKTMPPEAIKYMREHGGGKPGK